MQLADGNTGVGRGVNHDWVIRSDEWRSLQSLTRGQGMGDVNINARIAFNGVGNGYRWGNSAL